MKRIFNILSKTFIGTLMFIAPCVGAVSCYEKFDQPEIQKPVDLEANTTIAELKAMYAGGPTEIYNDVIIEGVVNSSDRSGNFYRSLYIQDATGGIELKIGKTGLYNEYPIGQVLYVKARSLVLGDYKGMLQLGAPSPESKYETSYMDAPLLINSTIFKGVRGDAPFPYEIEDRSGLNARNLGTIVTLKDVVYKEGTYLLYDENGNYEKLPLDTWAIKEDKSEGIESAYGNHVFVLPGGGEITVRTSGYARFAQKKVPEVGTHVNLTGILTRYNTTYQLALIDLTGVEIL